MSSHLYSCLLTVFKFSCAYIDSLSVSRILSPTSNNTHSLRLICLPFACVHTVGNNCELMGNITSKKKLKLMANRMVPSSKSNPNPDLDPDPNHTIRVCFRMGSVSFLFNLYYLVMWNKHLVCLEKKPKRTHTHEGSDTFKVQM